MNVNKVGIVIVHYKCWDYLEKCLISIERQSVKPDQIVIVNNGSDVDLDEKTQSFNQLSIQMINNDANVGFGAACNQGAQLIDEDALILFCNPDVEIPDKGLEHLIKSYHSANCSLLGCSQIKESGKNQKVFGSFPTTRTFIPIFGKYLAKHSSHDQESLSQTIKVDWITGAVILISHSDFKKIGGFDEDYFMFMEDVDLCLRARKLNMEVGTALSTSWIHHHGKSSISNPNDRVRSKTESIKSKHKYIQKNIHKFKSIAHLFVFLKYSPELFMALILGVFMPIKEIKVKQKVAINLLKSLSVTSFFPNGR